MAAMNTTKKRHLLMNETENIDVFLNISYST